MRRKRAIGQILVAVGLVGVAVSFVLLFAITQQPIFWYMGSITILGDGIYVMKQYYYRFR